MRINILIAVAIAVHLVCFLYASSTQAEFEEMNDDIMIITNKVTYSSSFEPFHNLVASSRITTQHHDSLTLSYPDAFSPVPNKHGISENVVTITAYNGLQKNGVEIYIRQEDGRILMMENYSMGVRDGPAYYGMTPFYGMTLFVNYDGGVLNGQYVQTCLTNVYTGVFTNNEWTEGVRAEVEKITPDFSIMKGAKIGEPRRTSSRRPNIFVTRKDSAGKISKEVIIPVQETSLPSR